MFDFFKNKLRANVPLHFNISQQSAQALKEGNIGKNWVNPLSANSTKWSNIIKQFVGCMATNCLKVFHHFMGLALKGLRRSILTSNYKWQLPEVYLRHLQISKVDSFAKLSILDALRVLAMLLDSEWLYFHSPLESIFSGSHSISCIADEYQWTLSYRLSRALRNIWQCS